MDVPSDHPIRDYRFFPDDEEINNSFQQLTLRENPPKNPKPSNDSFIRSREPLPIEQSKAEFLKSVGIITLSSDPDGKKHVTLSESASDAAWRYLENVDKTSPIDSIKIIPSPAIKTEQKLSLERFQKLTKLDCSDCESITEIHASQVSVVLSRECKNLTILNVIQATEVDCFRCPKLTKLYLPHAKNVDSSFCEALQELYAPQATDVDCCGCKVLIKLIVSVVININCGGCEILPELEAPFAKKVSSNFCKALIKLSIPQATEVSCMGCISLLELEVLFAKLVECQFCDALRKLIAPQAITIVCHTCKNLETLDASEVIEIDGHGCKSLARAALLKAIYANFCDCYNQIDIRAPLVEFLDCSRGARTNGKSANYDESTYLLFKIKQLGDRDFSNKLRDLGLTERHYCSSMPKKKEREF